MEKMCLCVEEERDGEVINTALICAWSVLVVYNTIRDVNNVRVLHIQSSHVINPLSCTHILVHSYFTQLWRTAAL